MDIEPNVSNHENVPPQLVAARVGMQSMSLGEIARAEEMAGQNVTSLSDSDKPSAMLMAALAAVIKQRTDPSFTFERAQALNMAEYGALMSPEDPKG
jgi:hypothetical protein